MTKLVPGDLIEASYGCADTLYAFSSANDHLVQIPNEAGMLVTDIVWHEVSAVSAISALVLERRGVQRIWFATSQGILDKVKIVFRAAQ